MLKYLIFGTLGLFVVIAVAYYILYKKMQTKETRYVAQLVEGTKESSFSMEIFLPKILHKMCKNSFY